MPECSGGVASRAGGGEGGGQEQVGDGENGAAGVSSLRSVGAQLLEVTRGSDTCFLLELTCCRLFGLLAVAQESAGEGQVILEGFDASAHDEGVEGVVDDGQGDDVDRDRDGEGFGHGVSITYLCRVDIKCEVGLSSS